MENTHKHMQIYRRCMEYLWILWSHIYTYKCTHTYAHTQTAESTVGKRQELLCSTKWKTRSSYLSNFLQGSSVEGHMCLRERARQRETDREGGGSSCWCWSMWYYAVSSIVTLKLLFSC